MGWDKLDANTFANYNVMRFSWNYISKSHQIGKEERRTETAQRGRTAERELSKFKLEIMQAKTYFCAIIIVRMAECVAAVTKVIRIKENNIIRSTMHTCFIQMLGMRRYFNKKSTGYYTARCWNYVDYNIFFFLNVNSLKMVLWAHTAHTRTHRCTLRHMTSMIC